MIKVFRETGLRLFAARVMSVLESFCNRLVGFHVAIVNKLFRGQPNSLAIMLTKNLWVGEICICKRSAKASNWYELLKLLSVMLIVIYLIAGVW